MSNFFNSIAFEKIIGVILVLLAIFELISSFNYTKGILQKGTNNAFSAISIVFSFFIGLILFSMGLMCLLAYF